MAENRCWYAKFFLSRYSMNRLCQIHSGITVSFGCLIISKHEEWTWIWSTFTEELRSCNILSEGKFHP